MEQHWNRMEEKFGLCEADKLEADLYKPTESFWIKWREDKPLMKLRGIRVVKICLLYTSPSPRDRG